MQLKVFNAFFLLAFILGITFSGYSQENRQDTLKTYKKRVLENTEVDFLMSYYSQDGDNAAVTGGIGTEKLTDITPTFVVAIPLNDDDILTIDAGISAYSSASSSNIDPFDGPGDADPFQASTGASSGDVLIHGTGVYSHSSDDRNNIWSAKLAVSNEYDYFSFGFGGAFTKLFNEKNTELSVNANVFLDTWVDVYPRELRPFKEGGYGLYDPLFYHKTINGNPHYDPSFTEIKDLSRNSYSLGFGFSQILSKRLQVSVALDLVQQQGLLSTPFQRVYFSDVEDSFIDNFHLADDIERLPDSRFKVAVGGRLHYYINEFLVVRTFYRYYFDDFGIKSHTASIELPVKLSGKFTLYPSYRYYNQTKADFFAPYNQHQSSKEFYTSDYDLSEFNAGQFGIGATYTDIFTSFHIWKLGLKSIDINTHYYQRNSGLKAFLISGGFSFVLNE
jgi:hypothetical protein